MNGMCACLNVKFMAIELPDGRKEERWICPECKSIFIRARSAMSSNAVLGDGWRDARKELPEKDVYVLCFCEEKDILNGGSCNIYSVGVYSDGWNDEWHIQLDVSFSRYKIIAWRPLPDQPAFA